MHELVLSGRELLACCASPVWVTAMTGAYSGGDALLPHADTALAALDWPEVEKALSAPPAYPITGT